MATDEDPQNFILMHAAGANVSGQIASVIAGGLLLCLTNLRKERFDVSRFNEITGIISAGMGRRLRGYLDYLSCFDAA